MAARKFFEEAFDRAAEMRRWGQRKKHRKEYHRLMSQMVEVRAKYPDVYEEVYASLGGDVESYRRWSEFLADWNKRLAEETRGKGHEE